MVDCVEIASRNPEKFRLFADPPIGRYPIEEARFRETPPDLAKFSDIATYMGRKGRISHPMILWSIE